MKRFTELYFELDATTRTGEKVEALERYFRGARDADAAWALALLTGRRLRRAVSHTRLREWTAEATGCPLWLIDECYESVGDLSETIALLVPDSMGGGAARDMTLAETMETLVAPMAGMAEEDRKAALRGAWARFDRRERLVFHKLISGNFRFGAAAKLAVRALANVAGVPSDEMAHRLTGLFEPSPEAYRAVMEGRGIDTATRPYPFYLATQLEADVGTLGPRGDWLAEWKWDGIRAQMIHRDGVAAVWSRGEEMIGESFPELALTAARLPDGTVLDGEVLAFEGERPLAFVELQKRLNRKRVDLMLFADVPVVFMAYDCLERDWEDVRERPIEERRAMLEEVVARARDAEHLRVSGLVEGESWEALARVREESRERGVEGIMLKRRGSAYRVGRVRGEWWKWKVDPHTIDCVLVAAQPGTGRRATLFTDYTFAVWTADPASDPAAELINVTKAYSGLTDEEFREVDAFVRANTLERHGPVRIVKPELVFEIAFEAVQASGRHRSGVALRFPRMARWRREKRAEEADVIGVLRGMV